MGKKEGIGHRKRGREKGEGQWTTTAAGVGWLSGNPDFISGSPVSSCFPAPRDL